MSHCILQPVSNIERCVLRIITFQEALRKFILVWEKKHRLKNCRLTLLSLKLTSFILFHKLKRVNKYTAEYLLVYDFFNE